MHSVNSGLDFAFRFSSVEINLSKKFKRIEFYKDRKRIQLKMQEIDLNNVQWKNGMKMVCPKRVPDHCVAF